MGFWARGKSEGRARKAPRVSLAPKTPFPFAFKRLPRRLGQKKLGPRPDRSLLGVYFQNFRRASFHPFHKWSPLGANGCVFAVFSLNSNSEKKATKQDSTYTGMRLIRRRDGLLG